MQYYYDALFRFPHIDDENPICRWPNWKAMHRSGFCSKRRNTTGWKTLILTLESYGLLKIDRRKNTKRLFK